MRTRSLDILVLVFFLFALRQHNTKLGGARYLLIAATFWLIAATFEHSDVWIFQCMSSYLLKIMETLTFSECVVWTLVQLSREPKKVQYVCDSCSNLATMHSTETSFMSCFQVEHRVVADPVWVQMSQTSVWRNWSHCVHGYNLLQVLRMKLSRN